MEIWRLTDGKAGHMRQTEALIEAIGALPGFGGLESVDIPVPNLSALPGLIRRARKTRPIMVMGAGHRTHQALVALKFLARVETLVIMRPSLPLGLFDWCVVPEHDGVKPRPGVVTTFGPLARAALPGIKKDRLLQVCLIGGTSPHFDFNESKIVEGIEVLVASLMPEERFVLCDSRRTPDGLLQRLADRFPQVETASHLTTSSDWLPDTLAHAYRAWVTPDSMSMIFEALAASCQTGIIPLVPKADTRIVNAVSKLVVEGWLSEPSNVKTQQRTWPDEAKHAAEALFQHKF